MRVVYGDLTKCAEICSGVGGGGWIGVLSEFIRNVTGVGCLCRCCWSGGGLCWVVSAEGKEVAEVFWLGVSFSPMDEICNLFYCLTNFFRL